MTPTDLLTIVFGIVIGFSLGLTGGGGSIFAVPLLVYGLGAGAREAVAVSLAAVGATSLLGALMRWRAGEIELRAGIVFAIGGLVGAPFGTAIGTRLPVALTLLGFATLVLVRATETPDNSCAIHRVQPYDPFSSYLVHKLLGTHQGGCVLGSGNRMPPGPPLSDVELEAIANWVLQGSFD